MNGELDSESEVLGCVPVPSYYPALQIACWCRVSCLSLLQAPVSSPRKQLLLCDFPWSLKWVSSHVSTSKHRKCPAHRRCLTMVVVGKVGPGLLGCEGISALAFPGTPPAPALVLPRAPGACVLPGIWSMGTLSPFAGSKGLWSKPNNMVGGQWFPTAFGL